MTLSQSMSELQAGLKSLPTQERESLAVAVVPALVGVGALGTASEEALAWLAPALRSVDRQTRREATAAVASVLRGTGEAGADRLRALGLDSVHAARDAEAYVLGACYAGAPASQALEALSPALTHPSPARRKAAYAGLALAQSGTGAAEVVLAIAGSLRDEDDFATRWHALDAIGAVAQSCATDALLAPMAAILNERNQALALDAGYNPLEPIARAAAGTLLASYVAESHIRPALETAGFGARAGRVREAAVRAWSVLYAGRGVAGAEPAWRLLRDPIRRTRRAALWSMPKLFAGWPPTSDLTVEPLLELGARGITEAACAALCLGVAAEGTGAPAVIEALLRWAAYPRRELARHAVLALGKALRRSCHTSAGETALSLWRVPETAPLAILAAGELQEGSCDAQTLTDMARFLGRKSRLRVREAAALAAGLVLSGAGVRPALAAVTPALRDRHPQVRRAACQALVEAVFGDCSRLPEPAAGLAMRVRDPACAYAHVRAQ